MAAPRRSGRSRFSLFILVLLSATLLTLDARDFGPVEELKDGIAAVVSPFRSVGDAAFSPVGNAWENFSNSDDLEAENERLRQEIEELFADQIEARALLRNWRTSKSSSGWTSPPTTTR